MPEYDCVNGSGYDPVPAWCPIDEENLNTIIDLIQYLYRKVEDANASYRSRNRSLQPRTARRLAQRRRRTRICQVLLKPSTVALRPGSPFGMKTRWMPKRRCNRMTRERLWR